MNIDNYLAELNLLESKEFIFMIMRFAIWILAIIILVWIVNRAVNRTIEDNTIRYRTKKLIRLFSYLFIILLGVLIFTGKNQYFTIALGLFGAGLAFALQEVLLSIAGWISIFSTKAYQPGDRIEINGIKGDVIDISITKTTLMEVGDWINSDNYSGTIVKVSNSSVIRGNVKNYSRDFPFLWDEIIIPIHYSSDLTLAKKIVQDTANDCLTGYIKFAKQQWKTMVKNYLIENAVIEPTLSVKLTDNWIELNLRYVVDYKKRRMTKSELNEKIFEAINRTDGKVKIASTTIEMIKD